MLEFKLSDLIIAKIVPTKTRLTYWQNQPYFVLFLKKRGLF